VNPGVSIAVAAICFAVGYRTRDYLTAWLPAISAAVYAVLLWRPTGGGGQFSAPALEGLMLSGLGVLSSLLGAALARERLGRRPRPEWLRHTLMVVLGSRAAGPGGAVAVQGVASKIRAAIGCLVLAAAADGLWIDRALYRDDPVPVTTGLLIYALAPALALGAATRGRARSRLGIVALYLAFMALVFMIWAVLWVASCGDNCR
jgi:hypothetical protein